MEILRIIQIVGLSIAAGALTLTPIYLHKASIYQKSTSAYLDSSAAYRSGDDARAAELHSEGDRLSARAERFARWLP